MSKIKVSELFVSLQGEGYYAGVPSVFLRTFGCNFRCRSFSMPPGEYTDEPLKVLEKYKMNPQWKFDDLPLVKTGCDSYAAVYPQFKDLSPTKTVDEIVQDILNIDNNNIDHLVITGGEPLLGWQKSYPELISTLGYNHITFETNGTQEIKSELSQFMHEHKDIDFTFSVSPKLPCSGEKTEDACKPDVVKSYTDYGRTYLKFVVANENDLKDVEYFISEYNKIGFDGEVYLMPMGGTSDSYNLTAPEVASLCLTHGYRYSPRMHIDLFGNSWGT